MQWHQPDHMQTTCTSLQTDNHINTSSLNFLQAGCSSGRPTNSVKALKAHVTAKEMHEICKNLNTHIHHHINMYEKLSHYPIRKLELWLWPGLSISGKLSLCPAYMQTTKVKGQMALNTAVVSGELSPNKPKSEKSCSEKKNAWSRFTLILLKLQEIWQVDSQENH